MEKHVIKVPKGIRYIGDWEGFYDEFPNCPHIMDKTITGCGFTEWCLTNNFNVILCSPRNILLDNKAEQHPGEVYRLVNSYFDRELDVDKDTTRIKPISENEPKEKKPEEIQQEIIQENQSAYKRINQELDIYFNDRNIKPKKILVTYDSFHILKDVLKDRGILGAFYVIVDEFQSIFTDARFKSSTELEFVEQLQDIEKVCYLSATPMMDKYLEDIPEFANLPYYCLDWKSKDETRVIKPKLTVKLVRSIYEPAKREIDNYRAGNLKKHYTKDENGNIKVIESKEVVFYMNSVWNIIQLINKCELRPEETNILCAKTEKNERQIKNKLGEMWNIGRVPTKNEPRKMFTLCTRTVYLGADFYSDNARSIILSDANVDCLAVDISLDLPQILGRQRLWENPWKNEADFYYKALSDKNKDKISQEQFDARIKEKMDRTAKKLRNWEVAEFKDVATEDLKKVIKAENYKDDYVGINTRGGKPTINTLVKIAEQRAFDIQQVEYADRFSVINTMENIDTEGASAEATAFFIEYDKLKTIHDKLKWLCEADLSDGGREKVESMIDAEIKSFLSLGKERLKSLGYHVTKVKKDLDIQSFTKDNLEKTIYSEFKVGDRIIKADLKERLAKIYDKLQYQKTPKATDLSEWFEIKPVSITIDSGKRVNGFELLKKK